MKKKTACNKTTSVRPPHVKWESLLSSIILAALAVILIVLYIVQSSGINSNIFDIVLSALSPLFVLLLGFLAISDFYDDFLPSLAQVRDYKARKAYLESILAVKKETKRIAAREEDKLMELFLEQNPQYRF